MSDDDAPSSSEASASVTEEETDPPVEFTAEDFSIEIGTKARLGMGGEMFDIPWVLWKGGFMDQEDLNALRSIEDASSAEKVLKKLVDLPTAVAVLSDLAAIAELALAEGDLASADLLLDRHRLLKRARAVGAMSAAREWGRFKDRLPASVQADADLADDALGAYGEHRDADDLDEAVARSWSVVMHNDVRSAAAGVRVRALRAFALILHWRAVEHGREEDLDQALSALAEAIRLEPEGSVEEALLRLRFARFFVDRGRLTGNLNEIQKGAAMGEHYVRNIPEDDLDSPGALVDLSVLYDARYEITGALNDLDQQIRVLVQALRQTDDGTSLHLAALHGLGSAYAARFERTGEPEDNDRSIELLERVLDHESPGGHSHGTKNVLATGLKARIRQAPTVNEINRVIVLYKEILAECGPDSIDYAGYINNYGSFLLDVHSLTGDAEHLGEARQALEEAVRRARPGSPDLPGYKGNLARAYRALTLSGEEGAAAVERAFSAYRSAVDAADPVSAELALEIAIGWGAFSESQSDWRTAAEAWGRARASSELLLMRQEVRNHKEVWLRSTQGLAAAAAYTHCQLGDARSAALALELGQGVLLREALTYTNAPTSLTDEAHLAALVEASRRRTLLYLASAALGGVAVLVRDGEFSCYDLPGLSRTAVTELLEEVRLDQADSPAEFDARLGRITTWLSQTAIDSIAEHLEAPLSLIPVGAVSMLPWHLAGEPQSLLDRGAVGFLPNAAALRSAGPLRDPLVLAVADPRPTSKDPLEGAEAEVDILVGRVRGTFLSKEQATREAVMAALGTADVVHLASHAQVDPSVPMRSSILLAHDEQLRLSEVLDVRLSARLVLLSACDSALPGSPLPDEVVSLPTSFLQAGALGVVGSLWPVDDTSTAVLMTRLWQLLLSGVEPVEALCASQQWMRGVTGDGIAAWSAREDVSAAVRKLTTDWMVGKPSASQPFASPELWGAFTYTGT
jgi:CHAT domain-containing protein